ncbi:MAG TPA: alpha-hydroxy acid oxidase [Terriglobales bacterium]|nr:alpha-hydroxy acid oxidase [Terriglobales bacterium]
MRELEIKKSRRRFLRFLAASPVLTTPFFESGLLTRLFAAQDAPPGSAQGKLADTARGNGVIAKAEQALDVMDFEPAARKALPPAHFGYLATGVDDDGTVRANREGFAKFQIRPRRLVDVEKVDMSVRLFGTAWDTPIVLSPVSSLKAFHPEGEVAVANAARTKGHLQMLSTVGTSSVEEVTAARSAPIWQQLYPTNDWNVTRAILRRAEHAGCPVVALTVDLQEDSNRETLYRSRRVDDRDCSNCHASGWRGYFERKPMFDGLDVSKVTALHLSSMNWDFVKRVKDATTMKLVIKGIVTREDAQLAVEHGADGIIVSNHGGRAEETLRSTIECLPEVLEGAGRRIPVLVDGGFRRGTDIFKALALGANAICIGRPYAWGLAAFGQPGVETVLEILRRELLAIMRQAGTPSVGAITPAFVVDHSK